MSQAQYATAGGAFDVAPPTTTFPASIVTGGRNNAGYQDRGARSLSRIAGIALVLLLHIGFIYALVSGLAEQAVNVIKGPLETRIIQEIKPPPKIDVPPPPVLAPPPPPYIPPPEVQIRQTPVPMTSSAITVVTTKAPPKPQPAPPAIVNHITVAPGAASGGAPCTDADDIYPAVSKELGEEGKVLIDALIGSDGSVVQTRLNASSGSRRLDAAALGGAQQICHFRPGTVDGQPKQMWVTIPFVFTQSE